jgi:hypothetical protein
LDDECLEHLEQFSESLRTLRIGNNKLKSIEALLAFIAKMKLLQKIDLTDNEVCKADDYREKVMAAMRKNFHDPEDRIVLDCKDDDGVSCSDNSEDDDEGEEGEFDMDGEFGEDELLEMNNLDPELIKKFQDGTITQEELKKLGYDDDFNNDENESGEEESGDVEGPGLEKKKKED